MENQRTKSTVGSQKSKPIVSPISPLSSYKSIIIVLCVGILLWMLLQGGTKHAFQFFKNGGKVEKPQSNLDKSKETIRNVYEQTTDTAKNKFQDVIDKVKTGSSNIKNPLKHEEPTMTEKITQVKDSFVQTAKETIDNLKEKSQETLDTIKEKSQAAMDSVKGTPPKQESFGAAKVFENAKASSQAAMDKAKDTFTETHTNILHMFEMPGLIEQAYSSLEEFLSPRLKLEEQIPTKLLGGAKAVVFLTVYKGGLGITGVFGSGIIVARNEIGHWSGPCAIALMGIDVGLNIGVEKSNHVIILRDDSAVRAFASIGQLKLGVDASIAAGPIGRDTSASLSVGDKGYATISSYSMATGAYVGLSFEGQIIAVRHDCNEEYYGKKVTALEILDGTVKPPKNKQLKGMYKLIDEYTGRSLVYPEHSTEL